MKRVIIDCDPGIDDSLAIIFAVKSRELEIEAITCVSGNLPADRTSINALKTLELIGAPAIPVAKGMMTPLVRPYPKDPFSHGDDGLGNTGLPFPKRTVDPRFAPDLMIETIRNHCGAITLLATGPLTNVALALQRDPEIARMVERAILIAGAYGFNEYAYRYATGDNPVSEWNVFVDPEAARIVFRSGMPILAIGVDVFAHPDINFRPAHLDALRNSGNVESAYLLKLVQYVESKNFDTYSAQIDALAVAALLDPTLVRTRRIHADVETKGELTLGQTVADVRAHFRWTHLPTIEAACEVDYSRYLDLLINTVARNDAAPGNKQL